MEQGAAVSQAPVAKRRSPGDEPPAMNAGRWTPGDGRRALNAAARRSRMADGRRGRKRRGEFGQMGHSTFGNWRKFEWPKTSSGGRGLDHKQLSRRGDRSATIAIGQSE
jgi:hypothetical protein